MINKKQRVPVVAGVRRGDSARTEFITKSEKVLKQPWGVAGVLVSHQWDVAGEDDYDTNITGGQYFYTLNLQNGWQITGSPTFPYNHEASSGKKWTFPLAVGASKTLFIGGRPWKFGLQYYHYIQSPDNFGPDFQIRITVSPVVKLPW